MADILALFARIPLAFGVLVAASYVGTTLVLRSYFDDDEFPASDIVSVDEPDEG